MAAEPLLRLLTTNVWRVRGDRPARRRLLRDGPDGTWASDHYGLAVTLVVPTPPGRRSG